MGLLVLGGIPRVSAQVPSIAHFVSPTYPPMAQRLMISGEVSLELTVDRHGIVTSVTDKTSAHTLKQKVPAHPLLVQEATACVSRWRFKAVGGEAKVFVSLHYGFSGETRETDPRTVVKTDFEEANIRVFITTDAPPMSQP